MTRFTLKKNEILSSKKLIGELFKSGQSKFKYPFKLIYQVVTREDSDFHPALFSISVPKRNIKKAVERNLIKRRAREAYRLNKHNLYQNIPENKQMIMMFVFVGKKAESYDLVEQSMVKLLENFKF